MPRSVKVFVKNIKGKVAGSTAVANKISPSKKEVKKRSGKIAKISIRAKTNKEKIILKILVFWFVNLILKVVKWSMVNNMKETDVKRPKIAVALGSGGARGLAHIGFLRALEDAGVVPDIITGTSIGAIIGGAYAAGISLAKIEELASTVRQTQIIDIGLPINGGFVKGNRASRVLTNFFKKQNAAQDFKDTKIKFGCAATDLVSGQTVYLKSGKLLSAIRASYSISGVFRPVKIDNMLLVDGGPLCRVPVRLARQLGADIVIGVDCAGPNVPISPKGLMHLPKTITRMFLMMEYKASENEIKESDVLVSLNQSTVDPLKIKAGLASINLGYKEGQIAVKKLNELLKKC